MKSRAPIEPDRPDVTNGTHIVDIGLLQIEFGGLCTRAAPGQRAFGSPFTARIGLFDWLEARIETDGILTQTDGDSRATGMGNVQLGAKLRIWAERGVSQGGRFSRRSICRPRTQRRAWGRVTPTTRSPCSPAPMSARADTSISTTASAASARAAAGRISPSISHQCRRASRRVSDGTRTPKASGFRGKTPTAAR